MWPELFTIPGLGLPIRSFGLMVGTGFLVAIWLMARMSKRWGTDPARDPARIFELSTWLLIGVLAGARLAFVLLNWRQYADDPLDIVKTWEGGLVMYGGLILALLLGGWKARKLGMPGWQSADYGLTAGFLGQMIGRIGCLMVGDDHGRPTDLPWAITFPDPLPHGSAFPPEWAGVPVHPTQVYMALKALALFGLGCWLLRRKSFHGQVTCVLLMGYAVLRSFIEVFRGDASARGGIFRDGLSPEEVGARLHGLGVADPGGRITDVDGYQALLRAGTDDIVPQLLLSSSQIISMFVFAFALIMYFRLRARPSMRVTRAA